MSANRWSGLPDQAAKAIEAAMARGRKIEAIKIYRQATNCGLKEAKEAVEAVEFGSAAEGATDGGAEDWRREMAHGAAKRRGSNWLTMVLVLIVVAVILVALLIARR